MSVNSILYAAQNPANTLNLSQYWQQAELNVFGDCCSSQANFNRGSTIVVRTSVNNGSLNAPSCYSAGGVAACASATLDGATTHLANTHDFNGDGERRSLA